MMVLDNFGVFGVGCHSERSYLISSPNRIVSDSFRAYFFVHDVTRSESFRNSKSSGNFLRQSQHDSDQVTILEGIWNFAGNPNQTLNFTRKTSCYPNRNWFSHLGPSKCLRIILWTIENVLRMCWGCENSIELLSGLIHEFNKWFNMGWDPNIEMHLPFVFLIIILALKHL